MTGRSVRVRHGECANWPPDTKVPFSAWVVPALLELCWTFWNILTQSPLLGVGCLQLDCSEMRRLTYVHLKAQQDIHKWRRIMSIRLKGKNHFGMPLGLHIPKSCTYPRPGNAKSKLEAHRNLSSVAVQWLLVCVQSLC